MTKIGWLFIIVLLGTFAFGTVELEAETGVAMPWKGVLKLKAAQESVELFERDNFRAYFNATLGYSFFDVHALEILLTSFSLKSSLDFPEGTDRYATNYVQQTYRLKYNYLLPPLGRVSMKLGLQANVFVKELMIEGGRQYAGKWTELAFGPSAEFRLELNKLVSLILQVDGGIGEGNAFIDIFTGLNFAGPFYFFRFGPRYSSTTNFSQIETLGTVFWRFGAQFRALF